MWRGGWGGGGGRTHAVQRGHASRPHRVRSVTARISSPVRPGQRRLHTRQGRAGRKGGGRTRLVLITPAQPAPRLHAAHCRRPSVAAVPPLPALRVSCAGNDLSRSFAWGDVFDKGWTRGHAATYATLDKVRNCAGAGAGAVGGDSRVHVQAERPNAHRRVAQTQQHVVGTAFWHRERPSAHTWRVHHSHHPPGALTHGRGRGRDTLQRRPCARVRPVPSNGHAATVGVGGHQALPDGPPPGQARAPTARCWSSGRPSMSPVRLPSPSALFFPQGPPPFSFRPTPRLHRAAVVAGLPAGRNGERQPAGLLAHHHHHATQVGWRAGSP